MSEVNDHNMQVYMDKWGSPHELIHHVKTLDGLHAGIDNALPLQRQPLGETAFFPAACGYSGNQRNALLGTRRNSQADYSAR